MRLRRRRLGAGPVYICGGSADALHCRLRSPASPCTLSSFWPASWVRVSPGTPSLGRVSPEEGGPRVPERAASGLALPLPFGLAGDAHCAGVCAAPVPAARRRGCGTWPGGWRRRPGAGRLGPGVPARGHLLQGSSWCPRRLGPPGPSPQAALPAMGVSLKGEPSSSCVVLALGARD